METINGHQWKTEVTAYEAGDGVEIQPDAIDYLTRRETMVGSALVKVFEGVRGETITWSQVTYMRDVAAVGVPAADYFQVKSWQERTELAQRVADKLVALLKLREEVEA